MAEGGISEALKKPPFANYDIVVYFGVGLFYIPFANRYVVEPMAAKWPNFTIAVGSKIAQEAVSLLSLLFFLYILGHIIAYLASQFIEKSVDRVFGKISSAILMASVAKETSRNEALRALIYSQLSKIKSHKAVVTSVVRFSLHLPVLPFYAAAFFLGIFGYYDTRIPTSILDRVRERFSLEALGPVIGIRSQWYKPLEYYVINRFPAAIPRMYNYLVISGLFRSLSFIFLINCWFVIYYVVHYFTHGDWLLKPLLGFSSGHTGLAEFIATACLYMFSLFSYLKFQRRYAEEAIFAFALSKDT